MRHLSVLLASAVLFSFGSAWAACSSPTGSEGQLRYDSTTKALFLCNGTAWGAVGGGAAPTGMVAMFATACPSGWTRFAAMDGRVPKGAAAYGATGGADTHTHTTNIGSVNAYGGWTDKNVATAGTKTSSASSSWPPYLEVVWCQKN